MDDESLPSEPEPVDPKRAILLGIFTTVLAIAFAMLVVGDQVTAATF